MSGNLLDMSAASPIYGFGPFVLDPASRLLLRAGDPVQVTPKAFDVLCVLADSAGRTVSKDTLMQTVWPDTVVDESNLAYQMSTLRKILGGERYIVTVPGQGYQLVTPVHLVRRDEHGTALEQSPNTIVPLQRTQRLRLALPLAFILVLVVAGCLMVRTKPEAAAVPAQIRSMAVLPFKPVVISRRDEALQPGVA